MKKGKHDYSSLLIYAAALVTVVRYSAAFIASDIGEITGWLSTVITILMGLSGLGMGILDTFGGVYLFDGWRHAMPAMGKPWSFRFRVLTGFVFALLITGVMILVPFTESRVTHRDMEAVLGTGNGLTWWAILVNVAPYLLIGGVAVGNSIVGTNQTTNKPEVPTNDGEPQTNSSRTFASLNESERLFIINSDSKSAARELGVTPRAIQKWRKKIGSEIK